MTAVARLDNSRCLLPLEGAANLLFHPPTGRMMARYLALFLVLAVVLALPFFFFGDYLMTLFDGDGAIEALRGYGKLGWLAAIALLISDLVLPIPTGAVLGALGILYGPLLGGVVGSLGSFLAGMLGYLLCRRYGRPMAVRLAGNSTMQRGEVLFRERGGWMVVLSRWLPVLPEVVACLAGLARMRASHFCSALACGVIPVAFTFAMLGHKGSETPAKTLILCAVLPVLLWLVVSPLMKRLEKKGRPAD